MSCLSSDDVENEARYGNGKQGNLDEILEDEDKKDNNKNYQQQHDKEQDEEEIKDKEDQKEMESKDIQNGSVESDRKGLETMEDNSICHVPHATPPQDEHKITQPKEVVAITPSYCAVNNTLWFQNILTVKAQILTWPKTLPEKAGQKQKSKKEKKVATKEDDGLEIQAMASADSFSSYNFESVILINKLQNINVKGKQAADVKRQKKHYSQRSSLSIAGPCQQIIDGSQKGACFQPGGPPAAQWQINAHTQAPSLLSWLVDLATLCNRDNKVLYTKVSIAITSNIIKYTTFNKTMTRLDQVFVT
ncbi:hypothetical protein HD554DRAFT_2038928 [Boletus coccyginus]|nr:hypothetical protein HD554DRAFT_2038928 [Boletus coccyginus]